MIEVTCEIWQMIIAFILVVVMGMCVGYSFAVRDSLNCIQNVENWIINTKSNQWVAYYMYRELEEKYESLLSEHEQYRGMVKALKDCKWDLDDFE